MGKSIAAWQEKTFSPFHLHLNQYLPIHRMLPIQQANDISGNIAKCNITVAFYVPLYPQLSGCCQDGYNVFLSQSILTPNNTYAYFLLTSHMFPNIVCTNIQDGMMDKKFEADFVPVQQGFFARPFMCVSFNTYSERVFVQDFGQKNIPIEP